MRSVTAVSKATNRVRNVGSWASTAANSEAYTTLSAIEPDWSTAITTSRARLGWRRPWPISRSGTIAWCSGTQWRRFARDRVRPVDVAGAGTPGPRRPGEGAAHGLRRLIGEPRLQIGEHPLDHAPRRRPGLVGEQPVEFDEQRHEMDVGLDRPQQLGFEEQLPQVEPLDGVTLEDLHDRRREVAADVAEPADDARLRPAEPAGPLPAARAERRRSALALVVERAERRIDPPVVADEHVPSGAASGPSPVVARRPHPSLRDRRRIDDRAFAEHETPSPAPLVLGDDGTVHRISSVLIGSGPAGASASTGRPSRWRTVTSAAAARSASTPSPNVTERTGRPVTSSVMIWRRSAGSNAPNVRRNRATTPSNASPVSDANHESTRQQLGIVDEHRPRSGEEALDERRARPAPACPG